MKNTGNKQMAPISNKGFTLVELIVAMTIFIIVLILSSQAFERIISGSSQEGKKAESNIQGIVGLELMRTDIEHAGYGLPWILSSPAAFTEMDTGKVPADSLADGIDSTSFNDSALSVAIDSTKVPRAFQSASDSTGADYLVVKSVVAGLNPTAKKWAYVKYSGASGANAYIKKWLTPEDITTSDRVITLNSSNRQLIVNSGNNFSYNPTASGANLYVSSGFEPAMSTDVYLAYGVDAVNYALRAPYNRADYYLKTPAWGISQSCAPGTKALIRGTLNHFDGGVKEYPLLDCVADMQIVYSRDSNLDGEVDIHEDQSGISGLSAKDIRQQVREVRVYILTHEGKADRYYSYPSNKIMVGEFGQGREFDPSTLTGIGSSWRNYRWKVYRIVATPRNLSS